MASRQIRRKQIPRKDTQVHFKRLRQRGVRVSPSIAAIYREDEQHRIELIGSGVFFQHQGHRFVLSAAHVLRQFHERPLWIGGEDAAIPLENRIYTAADPLDLGFVELTDGQATQLGAVAFLSEAKLEPDGSDPFGAHFLVVGYIAKEQKAGSKIRGVDARWATLGAKAAPPARYAVKNKSAASHLLLTLNRRRTYTQERQETMPKINGTSGSGVWRMAAGREELAAILIEHHDRKGNDIVATKIRAMIDGLNSYVAQLTD